MKGLTWDPVGKYIASQADDRSLKVWRTMDWQLETSITKPFDEVFQNVWLFMANSYQMNENHNNSDSVQTLVNLTVSNQMKYQVAGLKGGGGGRATFSHM